MGFFDWIASLFSSGPESIYNHLAWYPSQIPEFQDFKANVAVMHYGGEHLFCKSEFLSTDLPSLEDMRESDSFGDPNYTLLSMNLTPERLLAIRKYLDKFQDYYGINDERLREILCADSPPNLF